MKPAVLVRGNQGDSVDQDAVNPIVISPPAAADSKSRVASAQAQCAVPVYLECRVVGQQRSWAGGIWEHQAKERTPWLQSKQVASLSLL
jgi:hypothetical protein